MNFFKSFLASCLGSLVAFILLIFLSFFILSAMVAGLSADKEVVVKNNSFLHLNLDAQITEVEIENPFEGLPLPGGEFNVVMGLLQIKEAIREAADDPNIAGIYLDVSYPMTGFASLEEIRQSLLEFKESGKWIVAYGEVMSEGAYYLASVADKVYLNPEGEIEFNGLTVEISFYKRMFEKLEIKPEIFRVGDFKSAVEPFLLEKMSTENKLQLTEMVNGIYDVVLDRVSTSRNIPITKLEEISDKMLVRNATQAKQLGLVDSLFYFDQLLDELKNRVNGDEIEFIKYNKYRKTYSTYSRSKNEIAVIVADGTIMPGKADNGVVGADTFTREIRKAREDDDVKAIVIRVNSPGGSFQASDAMWREVLLATQAKPVIASMSDYAASGGYYLAMACDTIVAQPHTITGSIGIFSILFDASGLLNNKLGITTDEVRTGDVGELITLSRPLSQMEKNIWQKRTEEIYETFTSKAAEGRGVSQDEIKKVASGRVWTGAQAVEKGLVDVLGGYDQAIQLAAKAAGVEDDYKVKLYPRKKPFFEELMSSLEENAKVDALKNELGAYYPLYQQWVKLKEYHGVQARMPFDIQIQ